MPAFMLLAAGRRCPHEQEGAKSCSATQRAEVNGAAACKMLCSSNSSVHSNVAAIAMPRPRTCPLVGEGSDSSVLRQILRQIEVGRQRLLSSG
eukprot:6185166-Pleurochrysis_carterae.AAC.1